MPYVTPAWHCFDINDDPLVKHYKGERCVVHEMRTLDEYFYHCCQLEDIGQAMEDRNGDQVLSRYAHKRLAARADRVLVNVGQLWVWIVNKGTFSMASCSICLLSHLDFLLPSLVVSLCFFFILILLKIPSLHRRLIAATASWIPSLRLHSKPCKSPSMRSARAHRMPLRWRIL